LDITFFQTNNCSQNGHGKLPEIGTTKEYRKMTTMVTKENAQRKRRVQPNTKEATTLFKKRALGDRVSFYYNGLTITGIVVAFRPSADCTHPADGSHTCTSCEAKVLRESSELQPTPADFAFFKNLGVRW
jgi:hypothetical protein